MRRSTPEQLNAWRARSKPLAAGNPLARGTKPLPHRSPAMAAYYRDVRAPLVADLIRRVGACQAPVSFALAGEPDPVPCGGPLDVHERRRRSQGGSLETSANVMVLCRAHNGAAANAARGDVWNRAGIVVFEGDPGWEALGARRGERKQR